jgi:hypothetical protein
MVNVAPSFDESIWYINQRNNNGSLQRTWGRIQQQRWVNALYLKYEGDIDTIKEVTNFTQGELETFIRIVKIKDFVSDENVSALLDPDILEKAKARNFPVTILERLISNPVVREKWGIVYDGFDVNIVSNRQSFFNLFAELIKRIVLRDTTFAESPDRITTRTVTSHLNQILESLPLVSFEPDPVAGVEVEVEETPIISVIPASSTPPVPALSIQERRIIIKNDPNRNFLIPEFYEINTTNYRLNELFKELQKIRLTHKNCIGASLRVLIDLAVLNYINNENLETDICRSYSCGLRDVTLKRRIEYIKSNKLTGLPERVAIRLLDEVNEYSLDVLNGYIHGTDVHYLSKNFLNNFWNFLFPFLEVLLDIRERNV